MNDKLVVGCNYHTTWQRNKSMRFVLAEIKGDKARLTTRKTNKDFWTNVSDLIFIETEHNKRKAEKLITKPENNIHPLFNDILKRHKIIP